MIRLYVLNILRKIADGMMIRLSLWHLSLHGWRVRRSLGFTFIHRSGFRALTPSPPGPTFAGAGAGQPRATVGQGAIEYIVLAATLGLLVLFSGDFVQRVRDTLNESFAYAVGKMVPQ